MTPTLVGFYWATPDETHRILGRRQVVLVRKKGYDTDRGDLIAWSFFSPDVFQLDYFTDWNGPIKELVPGVDYQPEKVAGAHKEGSGS